MILVVLLGPPGVGKGTQAALLAKKFNLKIVATGDIFRDIAKEESDLAKEVERIINRGELIPDELALEVLLEKLESYGESNGFVLDGYPRNLIQAQKFDDLIKALNFSITCFIFFHLDNNVVRQRILTRHICADCGRVYNSLTAKPKVEGECDKCGSNSIIIRKDDSDESIDVRIEQYENQTSHLYDYYKGRENFKYVAADRDIEEIHEEVCDFIENQVR